MRKIIILSILFLYCNCKTRKEKSIKNNKNTEIKDPKINYEENKFNFKKIKNTIKISDISFPNDTILYQEDLFEEKKPSLCKTKLTEDGMIIHNNYNSILNENEVSKESIEVNGVKLNINKIISANENKFSFPKDLQILFISGIYSFNINNTNYILLGAQDRQFIRNIESHYWILLEMNSNKPVRFYSFMDGYHMGSACFGDFNGDNKLDYLNWQFNENKIKFYTLIDGEFKLNKDIYIYVNPAGDERGANERGIATVYSLLDKDRTNWFYSIE